MSEYPKDIMKAAGALAAWVYWGEHDQKEHAEAIAAAILAERERCAGVAKDWPLATLTKTNDKDPASIFAVGARAQASSIAHAIMQGGAA